jgi:hypothetical protein
VLYATHVQTDGTTCDDGNANTDYDTCTRGICAGQCHSGSVILTTYYFVVCYDANSTGGACVSPCVVYFVAETLNQLLATPVFVC